MFTGRVSTCTLVMPARGGDGAVAASAALLEFRRRLLHLFESGGGGRLFTFQHSTKAKGRLRQLPDDRVGLIAKLIEKRTSRAENAAQHEGRGEGPRQMAPYQPRHERRERVVDENAEHDRNHQRLRVLERQDQRQPGQERHRHRGLRCKTVTSDPDRSQYDLMFD